MHSKTYFAHGEGMELTAYAITQDEGLVVVLGGGCTHIGSVAIAHPRASLRAGGGISCTCSVLNQTGHKEESVARPMAEQLCQACNTTVLVSAGIHYPDIDPAKIAVVERLAASITGQILADLI